VSMAASLESRAPLLDVRLVNLLTKAPAQLKFRGASLKYSLKRAIRDVVPAAIVDRKDKMGFPVPLHQWRGGRFEELLNDTLLSPNARGADLFDQEEVRKLLLYEGPFGRRVWGLLNIELWLRECMTPETLNA
jgi:asparagine synthase (glutamine-hydrolysing)